MVRGPAGLLDAARSRNQVDLADGQPFQSGTFGPSFCIPLVGEYRQAAGLALGDSAEGPVRVFGPLRPEIIVSGRVVPHQAGHGVVRGDLLRAVWRAAFRQGFAVSQGLLSVGSSVFGRTAGVKMMELFVGRHGGLSDWISGHGDVSPGVCVGQLG